MQIREGNPHCLWGIKSRRFWPIDEAITEYKTAIGISPNLAELNLAELNLAELNLAEAHYNLGNAYDEIGKHDLAIESYQRAITIKPDSAEAHNNLGLVYRKLGKLDLVIESFKTAIAINPNLDSPELRQLINSQ